MKIAVATDDFETITGHVGRCRGFLVFEIENNTIVSVDKRNNNFTNHKNQNNEDHHKHDHSRLTDGLSDCSTLICTTAGWRLKEDFENAGKEIIFTPEHYAESAAIKYSLGTLELNTDGTCHSH